MDQAFDLRGTGYLFDAAASIEDWWMRLPARRAARVLSLHDRRRRDRVAELVALLRETAVDDEEIAA